MQFSLNLVILLMCLMITISAGLPTNDKMKKWYNWNSDIEVAKKWYDWQNVPHALQQKRQFDLDYLVVPE